MRTFSAGALGRRSSAQRDGHGDDPGDVVRATAPLALLAAADEQRRERRTGARHQHADALRAAELVGRQRQQVDVRSDRAQVEPARGLHGIGVQHSACGASRRTTAATSARSVIVPTSLLTAMTLTTVTGSGAAVSAPASESRSTRPVASTPITTPVDAPRRRAARRGARRPGTRPRRRRRSSVPKIAVLSASVPPLVKTTSPGRQPSTSATSSRASSIDLRTVAGEAVRARRVGEPLGEERQHRRDGLGAHRRGRRVVEVGEPSFTATRLGAAHWPATAAVVEDEVMDGYTNSTYGDAFADVYDDWYHDVSDVAATVESASPSWRAADAHLPVLELGVGTGRIAVPLAARGVHVVGLDASPAMLDRLAENDPSGSVTRHLGDMVDGVPDGPFAVVFVAFNTFFGLLTAERQQACFAAVADVLAPGGAFVIEAFVPEPRPGSSVAVRSMTVDSVVLSVSTHDDETQTAHGQYISFTESGGVRLRPWAIRYSTVEQLDTMASAAGFVLEERWEDAQRTAFTTESPRHVTLYRTIRRSRPP